MGCGVNFGMLVSLLAVYLSNLVNALFCAIALRINQTQTVMLYVLVMVCSMALRFSRVK